MTLLKIMTVAPFVLIYLLVTIYATLKSNDR